MAPGLLIWGAGGHARVVADIVRLRGEYEIAGFLDDVSPARDQGHFLGAPLHFGVAALEDLRHNGVRHVIVAIGDCVARLQRADLARQEGFSLASAIHPRAVLAPDARVDEGTVVAAGAVVAPAAVISDSVIINTGATVDHDSVVEAGAHVAVGARLAGRVRVGRGALVGMGAVILPDVRIGAEAVIGAGAVVLTNVPARSVAYGVPARIRGRTPAGAAPAGP